MSLETHDPTRGRGATEGAAEAITPADAPPPFTGIVHDLPFDTYLATERVSKSGLWTLWTRSPAHARVEKEPSNAMTVGTALHCAILEPDVFEERFVRGPEDRRGNKWKEPYEEYGERLLTAGDYDNALFVRDHIRHEPMIRRLTGAGTVREVSCFWTDAETGLPCRARPDAFAPGLALGVDLKTTADARAHAFRRNGLEGCGYHVQEAFYTDGWHAAGEEMDAFVFIVIEPKPPFAFQVYDLTPSAVAEGRAIYRAALERWKRCVEADDWPRYDTAVETLDLHPAAYALTTPPSGDAT